MNLLEHITWFDVFFFIFVALLEIHWYKKGKKDDKEFQEFKLVVQDQLVEIGQRLEIAIEHPVEVKSKHWYFCPVCEKEYEAFEDAPCPSCPLIRVGA